MKDREHGGGRGDSPALSAPAPDRLGFASLEIRQPAGGYRFSVDSVLLADFSAPLCGPSVLDLGTGCGIVLLLLARKCPALRRGVGVEIQEELFDCARANVAGSGLADRLLAVRGDLREPHGDVPPASFDLVVSNPPFRRAGEGRSNPDAGRAVARHELACALPELFAAAARALSPNGRFVLVSLAPRLPDLFAAAAGSGIRPETLRFVHPSSVRPAGRVLFAGRKGGRRRDANVLPPLFEYAAKGVYHPDMERIFEGVSRK